MATRRTIHALTGLRALASVWVLLFHLLVPAVALFPGLARVDGFVAAGFVGVDLFFVLSGFVLMHAYGASFESLEPAEIGRFYAARLARIYPLHAATTGALVLGAAAAKVGGFRAFATMPLFRSDALPAHVLLVQGWGGSAPAWNVPSWSLSCEWLAYLAFPAIALILRRGRRAWAHFGIAGLALLGFVAFALLRRGGELDLTYDGGAARVAGEFLAGCALAKAGVGRGHPLADRAAILLGAAIVAACALGYRSPWLVFAVAAFVAAVAGAQGRTAKALSGSTLRWLGDRSFALYMVQGPVILVARGLFPETRLLAASAPAKLAWLAAVIATSVIAAALAYAFVEEPARKASARWLKPRSAVIPAAPQRP